MNINEAKQILLLYRPGTRDGDDPEIAAALQLAKNDAELSHWFEEHCARQDALRRKFRQIAIPAGLKEQIISEQTATAKAASVREKIVGAVAVAAIVISVAVLAIVYFPHNETEKPPVIPNNLSTYLSQMAANALNSYYMYATTNAAQVHSYFVQYRSPTNYVLPAGLQKVALTGCAVEGWQSSKVSMLCFRTGKPLPPGQQSDLWLFVVDGSAVPGTSSITSPQFKEAEGLTTAVWAQDGKLYVLGMKGDEQTLQQFL